DMKKFFAAFPQEDETFAAMQKKLDFYHSAWGILKERENALMSFDKDKVNAEGELTKQAKKSFEQQLKGVADLTKGNNVFAKRQQKRELSSIMGVSSLRKAQALSAMTRYEAMTAERERVIESSAVELEKLTTQIMEFNQYNTTLRQIESPETDENTKRIMRKALASYEKAPYAITAEQVPAIEAEIVRLQQLSNDENSIIIDEENAGATIINATQTMKRLAEFNKTASDEELVAEYAQTIEQTETVLRQMKNIQNSEYLNEVRKQLAAHESGEKKLEPQLYQKYTMLMQYYHESRAVDTEHGVALARSVFELKKRMRDIARYGCTQGHDFHENTDSMEMGFKAKEMLEEQENGVVSVRDAVRINPFTKIFQMSESVEINIAQLKRVRKEIDSIKKIRELKEQQPDYYRLGLSYKEHQHAEKLLDILPCMERAYELTLRINNISLQGEITAGQQSLDELKEELSGQTNLYYRKAEALAKTDESNGAMQAKMSAELGCTIAKQEAAAKQIVDGGLEEYGMSEEQLEIVKLLGGLSFLEASNEMTEQQKASFKDDVKAIVRLVKFKENEQGAQFEQADKMAALDLLRRFSALKDDVMTRLGVSGGFSDGALFENRAEIEKCSEMGKFLDDYLANSKLKEKLQENLEGDDTNAADLQMLADLEESVKTISTLKSYAISLTIDYFRRNGLRNATYLGVFGAKQMETESDMREAADTLRLDSASEVKHLRINYNQEQKRDEIRKMEMRQRVRDGVGRELLASESKDKWATVHSFVEWGGNRLGAPLQFLGWALRDKRSMAHGEVRYAECIEKYNNTLKNEFAEMRHSSTLPDWSRGDGQYAPKIELWRYYDSHMKKFIRAQMEGVEKSGDADFDTAIEAMNCYVGVVGIVNSDTTEMEMAFLDTFKNKAKAYLEANETKTDPAVIGRCELLNVISGQLDANLNGTLADTMSAEELALIEENTIAYIEDTTFTENIEESNIKDIPLFLHEPNINDVRQSCIGDCWLVSGIGSVVTTNPDFIRSMFHDLGNGDVLVRLFAPVDAEGKRVEYSGDAAKDGVTMKPAYFKLRKHYETGWGNASDCPWVQLLEKAYALGGFNTRNEMKVRGNRLYNVTDELTMGQIDEAVLHLTGKLPVYGKSYNKNIQKVHFLDSDIQNGMVAGMGVVSSGAVLALLEEYRDNVIAQMEEKDFCDITYEDVKEYLRKPENMGELAMGWMSDTQTPIDADNLTEEQKTEILDYYINTIERNMEKMREGRRLDFTEDQATLNREQALRNGITATEKREMIANYFSEKRTPGYPSEVNEMVRGMRDCFAKGGTVSIAIPHCVSVLDVREHNGEWFVLMRDPFNIYNTEYTRQGEELTSTTDALAQVYTQREANRKLVGGREEMLKGGFRGTSWIRATEIYEKLTDCQYILPEHTQIPDYK
ncbi:MAG: hypothetical protein J6C75_05380, partial [Oscillospiraceae bacterium]|nr:hypothetical protein [Oscillospiraceae bacterium]